MNIGVIIGMATVTVGSAVAQKILAGTGKADEAMYMDLATKSGLAVTALTIFATFVKAVARLG